MSLLNIYILTSDKTYKILDISLYYWNKFIPNSKKYVLGFNYGKEFCIKFDNVSFISLGNTQNINNFTSYIYNYLSNIHDKYIILSLDDFFPLSPINFNYLNDVYYKMNNNNKLVKCVLNSSYYLNKNDIIIDNLTCNNSDNYKLSLQLSIWEKNYLLTYLIIPLSPWAFELYNTNDLFYIIKSTNIHEDYIFSNKNIILNFKPQFIIQTNPSSHLSSPYNHINLLGLDFNEIKLLIKEKVIEEANVCFGHETGQQKLLLYSNIKNNTELYKYIITLNRNFVNEYYYLYNNIYDFK